MNLRISHVSIGVMDLDGSLAFYRDVLGLEVTYDIRTRFSTGDAPRSQRRVAFLQPVSGSGSEFYLALNEEPGRQPRPPMTVHAHGLNHFSFYVDDIDAVHQRVVAAGVGVVQPPIDDDVDPWSREGLRRTKHAIFLDPDGVLVQVEQELAA